jgi:hypothetical protein
MQRSKKVQFRYLALTILFVMFIAFSYAIYEVMVSINYSSWWQYIIPIGFLWLLFLTIAYFLTIEK